MTTQTSDFPSVIHTLIEHFESTIARGNAADIADWYTDNGMLLPAGSDLVKGKQDIEAFWQEAMDLGIKHIKLDLLEVEQHDDTAIEVSYYTMRSADDQVIDQGKGIVIWKYEDDTWKLHRDIWTSSIAQQ